MARCRNPIDANRIIDLYEDLEADVTRVGRIRTDNMVNSLRRHDWAHRWKTILDAVGLLPTEALEARMTELALRADQVANPAAPQRQGPIVV